MTERLVLYAGQDVSLGDVVETLISFGYRQVKSILEEGDFSRRGDVLNVFAAGFVYPLRIEWEWEAVRKIVSFDIKSGFFIEKHNSVIILPLLRKKRKSFSLSEPLLGFLDIKESDYVVHVDYGIGIYRGRKEIEKGGRKYDFLEIEYARKEKLYIPQEKAYLLQKYVSLDRVKPPLSRLSTSEWKRTKERVQKYVRKFALELVRAEAARRVWGGFKFSPQSDWQREFEASFPYQETEDQKKAWQEVKKDMESPFPMDRLICGDVGYGKTEVAMRAAFKTALDSKQVAFLVPTTILAQQHFENFRQRIEKFPLRVELLCRFRTLAEQKRIVAEIRKGKVDIVIGTQRLLSPDVEFKDLGLLIVDEEQKFGVKQKEHIKRLKIGVDVLTLTATPIPRTLYMSLGGIKAVSIINTPPAQRMAVKTFAGEFNPQILKRAVRQEVERGGQIYIIEPYIKDLERIRRLLTSFFSWRLKIGVAHGSLPAASLKKVMLEFMRGKLDCLISTAIVESGIDIPQANTLVVDRAENFGLGDLHQLRGRVGRFNRQAYAYFFFRERERLSPAARQRLETIEKLSYLGAGFDIAMKDLELRGAGNILGQQQHGFVWAVGLDLYCRMLKAEIERMRKEFRV